MSGANKSSLTLDGIMKHMRTSHGFDDLRGSNDKVKLRNMGYFHGYKGYRFARQGSELLPIGSFDELCGIYTFDMAIKGALYPRIMFIETAIKGIVVARALENTSDASLSKFMDEGLCDCRNRNGRVNGSEMKRKLRLKATLQRYVSQNYDRPYVKHYVDRDDDVPVWSVIESMTLHDLGELVHMLPAEAKSNICRDIGLHETDEDFAYKVIETIRPLRNAIAHNGVVFDARFSRPGSPQINAMDGMVSRELSDGHSYDFKSIVDYVVLCAVLVRRLTQRKTDAKRMLMSVAQVLEDFYDATSIEVFMRCVGSGARNKIAAALSWLRQDL